MPADVARLVGAIRARARLSQRELAAQLGVTSVSVSSWERGRSAPRAATRHRIERLAAGLGLGDPLTVVVVDRSAETAAAATALLVAEDAATEVVVATDVVTGLLRVGTLRPQLVLLDVGLLPGGVDELAAALRGVAALDDTLLAPVHDATARRPARSDGDMLLPGLLPSMPRPYRRRHVAAAVDAVRRLRDDRLADAAGAAG